jgi:uncharacterized membrane protein YidH (DUF202 family)
VAGLAVGRLAPQLPDTAGTRDVIVGGGRALLAVALLIVGARRQHDLQRVVDRGEPAPRPLAVVIGFVVGGVLLAAMTVALVIARR